MLEGGTAQATTGKGIADLDLYNARSVKLAEATRVRLFLPGLKGGPADDVDESPDAKASAQAAASRVPNETALKIRKKLAKVAALAHANEAASGPGGGGSGGDADGCGGIGGGGGAGGTAAAGGDDDAGAGGMMMLVEAIVDLEDDDDDPVDYLVHSASGAAGGAGAGVGEGRAARPFSAKGMAMERTSPNGADASSRLASQLGVGGGGSGGAAAAPSAGPGGQGRGGGGGGRTRPGSAVAANRPSSASARRQGDAFTGAPDGSSPSRMRTGGLGTTPGDPGPGGQQRLPVWARLAGSSTSGTREKMAPAPPKAYKAVQGKMLSLGLGGPDDGGGLFMVADPAAPFYGVEPGSGAGAVAATAGSRAVWPPVMPPVGGWVRANAMVAAAASSRGGVGGAYVPYEMDYSTPTGPRRGPDPSPGGAPQPQYSNAPAATPGGPNGAGAYMRPRRLGSGVASGRTGQAATAVGPGPGPGPGSGGGGGGGPGSGGGAVAAAAAVAGPGPGSVVGPGAPGAVLRISVPRGSNLYRVGSEVVQAAPAVVFHKAYSSELAGEAAVRLANGSSGGGGAWSGGGWSGGGGGGGGGPGPPSGASSPTLAALQQRAGGPPSPVAAVPTAWPDTSGVGAGGYGSGRGSQPGLSSPLRYGGGGAGGGAGAGGGVSPSGRAPPAAPSNGPGSPSYGAQRAPGSQQLYLQQNHYYQQLQQQQQQQQQAMYTASNMQPYGNGYTATYQQADGYGTALRYNGSSSGGGGGGVRAGGNGAGAGGLYGATRTGSNAALLFATGSTPQVTPASMAAVAATGGGSGGGGGLYEAGMVAGLGGTKYRSTSFNQLAPPR